MPTIQQLVRNGRTSGGQEQVPALAACPQRRGVCTRVYDPHELPEALNSRRCVRWRV